MIWQDLVFGAGQIVFAIALIPALRSSTKPPRVTCLLTGGVLCAFAITFATMALTWSTVTSLAVGGLWLALAAQRRVHHDGGGPRPRRILEDMGRTPRENARAKKIVAQMIERGEIVMVGRRKGAKYGLPKGKT